MKGLALVWLLRHRREEIHGRLDAVVYAIFVGLGFAMVENIEYYSDALRQTAGALAVTVIFRGILTPFAHPLFTVSTAIGIAAAAHRKGPARIIYPLIGYSGAVVLHSLWNANLAFAIVVAPLFAFLCFRSIRASRLEEAALANAVAAEVANGNLPVNAQALLSPKGTPRFRDWAAAACDPQHPLYAQWRRRHLAWIIASDHVAALIADDDPNGRTTTAQIRTAACKLLRQLLVAPEPPGQSRPDSIVVAA